MRRTQPFDQSLWQILMLSFSRLPYLNSSYFTIESKNFTKSADSPKTFQELLFLTGFAIIREGFTVDR